MFLVQTEREESPMKLKDIAMLRSRYRYQTWLPIQLARLLCLKPVPAKPFQIALSRLCNAGWLGGAEVEYTTPTATALEYTASEPIETATALEYTAPEHIEIDRYVAKLSTDSFVPNLSIDSFHETVVLGRQPPSSTQIDSLLWKLSFLMSPISLWGVIFFVKSTLFSQICRSTVLY